MSLILGIPKKKQNIYILLLTTLLNSDVEEKKHIAYTLLVDKTNTISKIKLFELVSTIF